MPNEPRIELKNVRYAAFASEETSCFQATVYVDGKPFCLASNDGHGGPDFYEPIPRVSSAKDRRDLDDAIFELAKRINPNRVVRNWAELKNEAIVEEVDVDEPTDDWYRTAKTITADSVLAGAIGYALDVALSTKDLVRALRTKVVFATEDGTIWTTKKPKELDSNGGLAKFEDAIAARRIQQGKTRVAHFLRRLPIERAVEIFRRGSQS